MPDLDQLFTTGGPFAVAGGGIAWLLTWWRQGRRDAYTQLTESTQKLIDSQNATIQKQAERIAQLEGRIEQVTATMVQTAAEDARTKAELVAANQTIARLEHELVEWRQRWQARFPEEML